MATAQSKLTAQGQISVPAEVRRKLGLAPGSVIEWHEADGEFIVRRASRVTSEDLHKAAFPDGPPAKRTLEEIKAGIADYIKTRHARR
jgi:AbrB family looped-hinge helix DNA binding protein